jgi:hypothetical protein
MLSLAYFFKITGYYLKLVSNTDKPRDLDFSFLLFCSRMIMTLGCSVTVPINIKDELSFACEHRSNGLPVCALKVCVMLYLLSKIMEMRNFFVLFPL